ncbi:MAG TPA: hypothetical protein VFO07_06160 [Roseiflexaceae bacterium]|nr:hypothetical protein [Roseiflexaceae bacterium]
MRQLSIVARMLALLAFLALIASGCSLTTQVDSSQPNTSADQGAVLGRLVTAEQIGQNNTPVNETNAFNASSDRIYAIAEAQRIDPGTSMFARWSRDGRPFEDSQPVTANQEYQNTFVEFHLEPVSGNFDPGQYTVQFFVNGNPDKQTTFTVQ